MCPECALNVAWRPQQAHPTGTDLLSDVWSAIPDADGWGVHNVTLSSWTVTVTVTVTHAVPPYTHVVDRLNAM